jgi:hypothetical protein
MRAEHCTGGLNRRFMKQRVFLLALAALAVLFFSACTASLAYDPGKAQPTIALHTPAANLTPTPTSPPVTVRAFVSNPSPKTTDNIIVYVIFHISTNGGIPRGVAGASANLFFHTYNGAPVAQLNNQAGTQQTAADGWAAFPLSYSGLQPQEPILIDVTVSYQGQTYQNRNANFFTPLGSSVTPSPTSQGKGP